MIHHPRSQCTKKGNRSTNFRNDHVLITSESFLLPPKTNRPSHRTSMSSYL
ncbi:hypothetical protein M6B38_277365 [Iris pallida]|uniref:Uncharacterized protein n=1 Tax=Iris pallida TaxID=29817 RepID=A0AAX6I2M2_IRIPA|nr:hypothetical protein M6B38_277365 [Iris pallida]